jgi:hypothetical protein
MALTQFSVHVSADDNKILYLHDLANFASYRAVKLGDNPPMNTPHQLLVDPTDKKVLSNGWPIQGVKKFNTTATLWYGNVVCKKLAQHDHNTP